MASIIIQATALVLSLNLLFFTSVTSTYVSPRPPPPPSSTTPSPSPPGSTTPSPPPPGSTTPAPPPPATGNGTATCPLDALQLALCVNLLDGLLSVIVGSQTTSNCCSLLGGLLDLEAALCLCTVIRVSALGIINLNIPLSLSLLLNACNLTTPSGFQCPTS